MAQQPDVGRHEDDDEGEGEEQALDQLDDAALHDRRAPDEPVHEDLEADPARALDQDHVAGAEAVLEELEGLVRVGRDQHDRPGRGRQRAAPGAIPPGRRRPPTTTRGRRPRPRRLADLAVAGLVPIAQLEHLAEDGHAAAGQAGQQLEGGADRGRRGVVAVVEDRHVAGPDEPVPMRRRPAVGEARRRSSRSSPAASPTAAAARALWTACRPRAGIAATRSARAGVTRRNRMPSNPAETTSVAWTSASGANP